LRLRQKRSLLM